MKKVEEQAKAAVEAMNRYENALNALNEKYGNLMDNVSVNDYGEADADEILNANRWYEEEKARCLSSLQEEIKAGLS